MTGAPEIGADPRKSLIRGLFGDVAFGFLSLLGSKNFLNFFFLETFT